ncbi:MAG: 30S ribosomal protein S17e [Candidatus Aenigmatarchaeota archaeon]
MGRIKTSFIKNIALDLVKKYPEKFTRDFYQNKEAVKQLVEIKSKKLRNMIAGYITSLKKRAS